LTETRTESSFCQNVERAIPKCPCQCDQVGDADIDSCFNTKYCTNVITYCSFVWQH